MHGSETDVTGQLVTTPWLDVFDALEQSLPSPLAGEGQGEGDRKPVSTANTSTQITKLNTQNFEMNRVEKQETE
ncbi:MAG: hypothetical protein P8098_18295 [Candidatus Thiodiazotropha sp.]